MFSEDLHDLVYRFSRELDVVFKHLPGKKCLDQESLHDSPYSCLASWAADAARQQGRFWPFHDALFAHGADGGMESIRGVASRLSLDLERFEVDWASPVSQEKVKSDIELGISLGIDATPAC